MGKGGRIACIFTPMVLTIASLVALAFLEASGWSPGSPLNNNYLMSVDFSNFTVADAGSVSNSTELTAALTLAEASGQLKETYRVYLWNYCSANKTSGDIDYCSDRQSGFVFDPVEQFALNATDAEVPTGTSSGDNAITSAINNAKENAQEFQDNVLGDAASGAMKVYKRVAKWNFIAYQVAFWTTVITIVVGLLAICSRWGSLCTWIMAIVSLIPSPFSFKTSQLTRHHPDLNPLHLPRLPHHHNPLLLPHRRPAHPPRTLQHQSKPRHPRPRSHLDRNRPLHNRDPLLAVLHLLLFRPRQPAPPQQ
jgi:hypothetical protein